MIASMDRRRSAAKRTMWLAVAISTVLCVAGTALVFVAPVVGFALLFISFCVFSVVPFLAFGLLGTGRRDAQPEPLNEDGGGTSSRLLVRAASREKTSLGQSGKRRRR